MSGAPLLRSDFYGQIITLPREIGHTDRLDKKGFSQLRQWKENRREESYGANTLRRKYVLRICAGKDYSTIVTDVPTRVFSYTRRAISSGRRMPPCEAG